MVLQYVPIASFHITFQIKEVGGKNEGRKEGRKGKGITTGQTKRRYKSKA
jgi:hypothetical protein